MLVPVSDTEREELIRLLKDLKPLERAPYVESTLHAIRSRVAAAVENLRRSGNLTTFDDIEVLEQGDGRIQIFPVRTATETAEETAYLKDIGELLANYNRKAKDER